MRKATQYKVSGVLNTKPTNLPEGLNVEEISVSLRDMTLGIHPIHSASETLNFTGYEYQDKPGLVIPGNGIFSEEETRKLRDFLNDILGDSGHPMRVLRDVDGDVWFELEPNSFTLGAAQGDSKALEKARYKHEMKSGYHNRTYEYVEDTFGPVVLVANTWE